MYYVYVENNSVASILPYEADVPESIEEYEITDEDYELLSPKDNSIPLHYFNTVNKKVEAIPQEALDNRTTDINRRKRDYLLSTEVDPLVTNPLRWNDFTEEQQQAITKYRRELLDITLHSNWPNLKDEDWPTLSL